jgi:hypothetical protein
MRSLPFGIMLAVAVVFYPITVAVAIINPEALEAAFDSAEGCKCPCYSSKRRDND